jgi:hypothetical protein
MATRVRFHRPRRRALDYDRHRAFVENLIYAIGCLTIAASLTVFLFYGLTS